MPAAVVSCNGRSACMLAAGHQAASREWDHRHASERRGLRAIDFVCRGAPTSDIIVIHAREVIMHQ